MDARAHNKLLSIFFFVQTGLTILGGIFAVLIYGGAGLMMYSDSSGANEPSLGVFFIVMSIVIVVFVLLFSAFYGFTGWKLYKEERIGRILGIICSCIFLLGIPIGTAVGIYGLWFLLGEKGKQFYSGDASGNFAPPPPPNSWQ